MRRLKLEKLGLTKKGIKITAVALKSSGCLVNLIAKEIYYG